MQEIGNIVWDLLQILKNIIINNLNMKNISGKTMIFYTFQSVKII